MGEKVQQVKTPLEFKLSNYIQEKYPGYNIELFELGEGRILGVKISQGEREILITLIRRHRTYTVSIDRQYRALGVVNSNLSKIETWKHVIDICIDYWNSLNILEEPIKVIKSLLENEFSDRGWRLEEKEGKIIIDSNFFKKNHCYLSLDVEDRSLLYSLGGSQKSMSIKYEDSWRETLKGMLNNYGDLITFYN